MLYQKNAGKRLAMASTTKVMTAAAVFSMEEDLDRRVAAEKKDITVEGSSMGLLENEEVSVRDLLYGLMLNSGNDAAKG